MQWCITACQGSPMPTLRQVPPMHTHNPHHTSCPPALVVQHQGGAHAPQPVLAVPAVDGVVLVWKPWEEAGVVVSAGGKSKQRTGRPEIDCPPCMVVVLVCERRVGGGWGL